MEMSKIFQHKHQKLISQCYPPGKAVDKKANSSELSYLLYYASSRRVKLEKVINYLSERTVKDSSRNRAGNLQVTLQIVQGLIEKCSGNLNVFAQQVCDILQTILNTKDIALCKNAIQTYRVFCEKLQGPLFSGDNKFVVKFTQLSQTFISFGTKKNGPNQYEWQMISLLAIFHISKCLGHSSTVSESFINMSIPRLTQIIQTNNSQTGILTRLKMNCNLDSEDRRLSRVLSAKTQQDIAKQIDEDFANDTLTLDDITEQAYTCITAFFNTNSTSQIWQVTKTVVQNNIDNDNLEWGIIFLELCVSWIPVQLRFISLSSLLSTLTRMDNGVCYNTRYQYARHLLGLLSSSRVNMIGLSVADIIQQLLGLITDLFLKPNKFTRQECNILTGIYSDCMCNLTTHIYYHDQVPDSIQEILVKIDSVLADSFQTEGKGEETYELIIQLLESITKIFQILKSNSNSSINRNNVTLEHWDISLSILAPKDEFEDKKTSLTDEHIQAIQVEFLNVFQNFLNNELAVSQRSDQLLKVENKRDSFDSFINNDVGAKDYLKPNINQYISEQQNFISHYLVYVDKFLTNIENLDVVESLLSVTKNMIDILGINFFSNFVPFFHHWQLKKPQEFSDKFKDTFAYIIMDYSLESLDAQYDIENYCKQTKLYKLLKQAIQYRKTHGLWIDLESEPDLHFSEIPNISNEISEIIRIKRNDMEWFACENNFLIQWLHPPKQLITEINKPIIEYNGTSSTIEQQQKEEQQQQQQEPIELPAPQLPDSPGLNSNYYFSSNDTSITSDKRKYAGLGLGTANDITSIQNEILQNNLRFKRNGGADHNSILNGVDFASIYTADSKPSIRVADLKDVMSASTILRKPSFQLNDDNHTKISNIESILNRSIVTTHIDTILNELESEDDAAVIV